MSKYNGGLVSSILEGEERFNKMDDTWIDPGGHGGNNGFQTEDTEQKHRWLIRRAVSNSARLDD